MTEIQLYSETGFKHYKSLIPPELIDKLLIEYSSTLLPSTDHYFRQSTQKWEKNNVDSFGYCTQSFLDPHDFPGEKHKTIVDALRKIYFHKNIANALNEVTGNSDFNLMQSMFFDKNTATRAHQDRYYLDSIPKGHLEGVWIALEDIHPEAGQFFLLPTTQKNLLSYNSEEKISDTLYKSMVEKYVEENQNQIVIPEMKKGDVIIWNSGVIHGATSTINQKYSRKSLTAHMMPAKYQFGNDRGLVVNVNYADYKGRKYRRLLQTYQIKLKFAYSITNYLSNHWPLFYRLLQRLMGKNSDK
ncbi:MAG: phytanoyl-CoA dioxygenase family protein [Flavobacteriales bacterium]|nr:phytanoyl-CoA dioxygenase family protein [Flavobacteriales bacterium]